MIPPFARGLVLCGVQALYFTLLTWLFGWTLGKWTMGLRVRSLDGERVRPVEAFERFIGYLHIPALLFWPIVYLWTDPNRQLPHDRVARTVVLQARRRVSGTAAGRGAAQPEPPRPEAKPPEQEGA